MYVVSFRIPYEVMGRKAYINGAASSLTPYDKGSEIVVFERCAPSSSLLQAEVLVCLQAGQPYYDWEILSSDSA